MTRKPTQDIADLIAIMAALRTPVTGCPWDILQTFDTIVPFTIDEAYEVADAIARRDYADLKDELGDLLLQVVYHARMAEEQGLFAFGDVVEAISAKMIRRHPHVFGDLSGLTPPEVNQLWARIKAEEKRLKGAPPPPRLLDDVPVTLEPVKRAQGLQDKAATVGFDWNDPDAVLDKVVEEAREITEARATSSQSEIEDEIGDLLFVAVNLARHLKVDAHTALMRANDKFRRRFDSVESALQEQGKPFSSASLDEMEALWQAAKRREKTPPDPSESR